MEFSVEFYAGTWIEFLFQDIYHFSDIASLSVTLFLLCTTRETWEFITILQEEFEDIKGLIRIRKLKDRQHRYSVTEWWRP
jgi:hypothetical protein